MPKTVGSTQNTEKNQQELLAEKTIHMQKKEEKQREEKNTAVALIRKMIFPFCKISGY